MLTIDIPSEEFFLPEKNEFVTIKGRRIQLEHSLISISKWESKWKKAFLKKDPERSVNQIRDYVRCMTLTQNVDPKVYLNLSGKILHEINEYINDPMSATVLNNMGQSQGAINRDTVTSELIYYWMVSYQIPFECQKWHLNRLLKLIEVCNVKSSSPTKPMTRAQKKAQAKHWSSLNAARRAKLGSGG